MKKAFVAFTTGVITGVAVSYLIYKNKEQLKEKLDEIEKKVKDLEIKEKIEEPVKDLIKTLKNILDKTEKLAKEETEEVLDIVEDKIKKLEEIIKR